MSTVHRAGVTVTADATGVPSAIHIDPGELRFGAAALAARILELTHQATRASVEELQ